jgi:hypothetical protein
MSQRTKKLQRFCRFVFRDSLELGGVSACLEKCQSSSVMMIAQGVGFNVAQRIETGCDHVGNPQSFRARAIFHHAIAQVSRIHAIFR